MKKNFNSKSIFGTISTLIVLVVMFSGNVMAQVWTIYDGSVMPTANVPPFITASVFPAGTLPEVYNAIIDDPLIPANRLLRMDTHSPVGNTFLWRRNFATDPVTFTEITIVMRARGHTGRTHTLDLDIHYNNIRSRISLTTATSLLRIRNGTGTDVTLPATFDATAWNTYRVTMTATHTNVYLNEDPTPVLTFVPLAAVSTNNHFRFGDGDTGASFGADIDWVIWDVTGAYAPGQGTAIPPNFIPSSNANLSDLLVNGITVTGFDPAVLTYNVELPFGTTVVPVVTAVATDANATVDVTPAPALPGTAMVSVTAQDQVTVKTYTVEFNLLDHNWGIYDASLLPDANVPTFMTAFIHAPLPTGMNEIIDDPEIPGNRFLRMDVDLGTQFKWRMNFAGFTPPVTFTDLTVVMRVRGNAARDNALDLDMHYNNLRSRISLATATSILRVRNGLPAGHRDTLVAPYNPTEWNIYRVTMTATQTNVYLNEDPTPVFTFAPIGAVSANNHIRFGDGASGESFGADIDWVIWDITGAYAPGQASAIPDPVVTPSWNANLSDLLVNGITVTGFDPAVLTYNVVLPIGAVLPVVAAVAADANALVSITQATAVPGAATVRVPAEDGTMRTYTVNFRFVSTDATLSNLLVDGVGIAGFAPGTTAYDLALPIATIEVPVVTAVAANANAVVSITPATALPGSTTVTVTAEDSTTTMTYTVNFRFASVDATLSNLLVNGIPIAGFDPTDVSYDVVRPVGSAVPTVTAVATDANAVVAITNATAVPGTATVEVTAEDGTTTMEYTVNFQAGPAKVIYFVHDPTRTDPATGASPEFPVRDAIVAALGYNVVMFPTVRLENATPAQLDELRGADLIIIGRAIGSANWTAAGRTIWNTLETPVLSTNPFAIRRNHLGWSPSTTAGFGGVPDSRLNATVMFPADPIFDGIVLDANNQFHIWNGKFTFLQVAATDPGNGRIMIQNIAGANLQVKFARFVAGVPFFTDGLTPAGPRSYYGLGDDGDNVFNYFAFSADARTIFMREVERLANLAPALSDLLVGGATIAGFAPNKTNYTLVLPIGAAVPEVTAVAADANYVVAITQATAVPGTATVKVTAEDGTTTRTYSVNFRFPSANATLSNLLVGGVGIAGFAPGTTTYELPVPIGSAVPVVTAVAADANAVVAITQATALPGAATVIVTAEDGTTEEEYTVNFRTFIPSIVHNFENLAINDSLNTVGWSTNDAVAVVVDDPLAPGTGNEVIQVSVVNWDSSPVLRFDLPAGANLSQYTAITFRGHFASGDVGWKDIRVRYYGSTQPATSGTPTNAAALHVLGTFNRARPASTAWETITIPITGLATQTGSVWISFGLNTSRAAAGPPIVPTIWFADDVRLVGPGDNANLASLRVNDVAVPGFSPDVLSYNRVLPIGAALPVVSAVAANANAVVAVTQATAVPGAATVKVTAEDNATTKTYTVNFRFASADATLSNLLVGGVAIAGFAPAVLTYDVVLPAGTTVVPAVTAVATDANAGVAITQVTPTPPALLGQTRVRVTAEDGTTIQDYFVNFTVQTVVNLTEVPGFRIYPNPAGSYLVVEWGSAEGEATVEVINTTGQVVIRSTLVSQGMMDISQLRKGTYILQITAGQNRSTQQFVKQ